MDWSGVIGELKSGGWKLFAVLFLVATAIAMAPLLAPGDFPEPFPKTIATARLVALASAVVLCCYLAAWIASWLSKRASTDVQTTTPKRLRSRFSNEQQVTLLRQVYGSGKRTFPWQFDRFRWFEQLQEEGFIVPSLIHFADSPLTYEVTVPAWQVLRGDRPPRSAKMSGDRRSTRRLKRDSN